MDGIASALFAVGSTLSTSLDPRIYQDWTRGTCKRIFFLEDRTRHQTGQAETQGQDVHVPIKGEVTILFAADGMHSVSPRLPASDGVVEVS